VRRPAGDVPGALTTASAPGVVSGRSVARR
jgi:hypothetical protein